MTERIVRALLLASLCAAILGMPVWAARVIPNRFDLAQEPGTTETYTLVLEGDQAEPEELRLYLGDWERLPSGEHDWGIPANGARWTSERMLAAGETIAIQYRVGGAASGTAISGSFRTGVPQVAGTIYGASSLDGAASLPATASDGIVVSREIAGDLVTLRVQCREAFQGLTITEVYAGPATLVEVDAAGGRFDTVERSCTAWIDLTDTVVQLQPNGQREVAFRVTTPPSYAGSYWSALFVEAAPQIVEQGGTRILSIPRAAIKIFVTAPGTEVMSAAITGVEVTGGTTPTVVATLENRGNVEIVVAGEAVIVDRSGAVVGSAAVADAKVLPGATRAISFAATAGKPPLPSGVYQATVQLEYGGGGPVVGVRAFRIP